MIRAFVHESFASFRSELVGSAEERPRVNRRGTTPAETAKEFWKRAVAIPFLDIVSSELQSRFSHEKRAHYELCALVPEVISKKDENAVTSLLNVLKEKWEHILPLPAAFESELFRWSNHWQEAMPYESVASIIASHADGISFPNIHELLKILLSYLLEAPRPKGHSPVSADSTPG